MIRPPSPPWFDHVRNTELLEMIVGVVATCHTQCTWDRSM